MIMIDNLAVTWNRTNTNCIVYMIVNLCIVYMIVNFAEQILCIVYMIV